MSPTGSRRFNQPWSSALIATEKTRSSASGFHSLVTTHRPLVLPGRRSAASSHQSIQGSSVVISDHSDQIRENLFVLIDSDRKSRDPVTSFEPPPIVATSRLSTRSVSLSHLLEQLLGLFVLPREICYLIILTTILSLIPSLPSLSTHNT